MPNDKVRIPKYRLHKPSRQAVVTLSGTDHYLGEHGTIEIACQTWSILGS